MNIWQDSNNAVTNSIPNSSTASEPLQKQFDKINWKEVFQKMDEIRQEENKVVEQHLGYWQIKHNWPNKITIVDTDERNNKGNN